MSVKILPLYFFILAAFIWSADASNDVREDFARTLQVPHAGYQAVDDLDKFLTVNPQLEDDESLQLSPKASDLETYFERPTRASIPKTGRQVLGGIGAACSALPSIQVLVPISIMGLFALGVTNSVIPESGVASWLFAGAMAIPAIAAGGTAAYRGIKNLFTSSATDIAEAEAKATNRQYTTRESWTYSKLTKTFETLLLGGLFFAYIMNIESSLDPAVWGNPLVWGAVFGLLALPLIYYIFVRPSNNPNKDLFRPMTADQEILQETVADTVDVIRHYGETPEISELGEELNVLQPSLNIEDDAVVPQKIKLKYILIFEKMISAANSIPPYIKTWRGWNHNLSKWASVITGAASLPMKYILSYYLPYKALTFLDAPSTVAMGVSISVAILVAPPLTLAASKGLSIIKGEYKQLLDWFHKPRMTSGYWGERFAPLFARGTTFILVVAISDYINTEVLTNTLHIANPGLRIALIAPFAAGPLWSALSRFFDTQYTVISNWFAKGAKINFACCKKSFRLCYCECVESRANALKILTRVLEIKDRVIDLNGEYAAYILSQLPQLKQDDPTRPLLSTVIEAQ